MENNFLARWGWYTLRNSGDGALFTVRNNIYSDAFVSLLPSFDASPTRAYRRWTGNPETGSVISCNRYENGNFVEQKYVEGDTHDITSCPSY